MIIKGIFYLILIVLFTLLIMKNNQIVNIDLLFYKTKTSIIVVIIISFLLGIILSSILWIKKILAKNDIIFNLKHKLKEKDEKSK